MSADSLLGLIVAGDVNGAVQLALLHPVTWVQGQLDYDTMDEHAETVSEFFQSWLPALPPLERLHAADWATAQYILPLVHLEHSYGIGARLFLEAYRAAAAELAQSLRSFVPLTDGPDAEVSSSVADRMERYAEQLEGMNFDATSDQSPLRRSEQ